MISALIDLLGHYYHIGDFGHMGMIARTTLAAIPDDVVSMQFLGLAYLRTGREQSAVEVFRNASDAMGARSMHHAPDLNPLDAQGDLAASTICLVTAGQSNPKLAPAWEEIGRELNRLGFPKQAENAFVTARRTKMIIPEESDNPDCLADPEPSSKPIHSVIDERRRD